MSASSAGARFVSHEVFDGAGWLFLEGYLFDKDTGKAAFLKAADCCHAAGGQAGIALSAIYAPNGWVGQLFAPWGIKIAYTPLGVLLALVAGMVAGADSISDMDLLRHGGMGRAFTEHRAPTSLGTHLLLSLEIAAFLLFQGFLENL